MELSEQGEIIMSDLWLEIYSHLMERDEEALRMQHIITIEMERLLIPYKSQLTEEELEKLHYLLYDVINVAQKEAMLYGMKFMMKFLLEL